MADYKDLLSTHHRDQSKNIDRIFKTVDILLKNNPRLAFSEALRESIELMNKEQTDERNTNTEREKTPNS